MTQSGQTNQGRNRRLANWGGHGSVLLAEYQDEFLHGGQVSMMDDGTDDHDSLQSDASASAVLTLGDSPVAIKIQPEPDVQSHAVRGVASPDRWSSEPASQDQAFYSALRPGESQMPSMNIDDDSGVNHHEQRMLFDDPLAEEMVDCLQEHRENRHRLDQALEWMDASERAEIEADKALMVGPRGDTVLEMTTDEKHQPGLSKTNQQMAITTNRTDPRRWKSQAPFSWRRLCLSAVVSGGLGSLALMVVQWVAG